ncbi:hypothetical protein SAMN02746041_02313 [Desulfacinum hydrothermale DSM 13146]|uniref:Uncharacterized protein n=1 Tax=Desulfacinum hydrothermale DSM 13146 TaxID=1121390 RepID=A0A1W1XPE1_9BACT|nr:hypothetical protein [Desulfacinum hydrothermale]SMC25391.1 hypothetical protein SAMN02746041_02313 [Desulfacinum hydrothermale DSM 13146]
MTRLETRSLPEYFKEAVEETAAQLEVDISELARFYLVDLLSRYTQAKALLEPEWGDRDKGFGQVLLESQGTSSEKRARILRGIGDTTLFLSGFFSDSFQRSLVDIDYYATIGRTAYKNLESLLALRIVDWGLEGVFEELSERFLQVVDMFAEISEAAGTQRSGDILRIYERWLRTRSPRDRRLLREAGILPIEDSTPEIRH